MKTVQAGVAARVERMSPLKHTHDRRLEALYRREPSLVAYLDESLNISRGFGDSSVYLVSALVVPFELVRQTRENFRDIAGSDYWHTTESFRNESGRGKIVEFVDYLANVNDIKHIVVEDDEGLVEADSERARERCLVEIARVLHVDHGVDLIVYERRRVQDEPRDQETVDRIHGLHRELKVHAGTPSSEPMLWGPDILAAVLRRHLALGEKKWFAPLVGKAAISDTHGQPFFVH